MQANCEHFNLRKRTMTRRLNNTPLILSTVLASFFTLFSAISYAQISTYDSMYFPTTQSLEGTRNAPVIYDVINIKFNKQAKNKAILFNDIKQAYAPAPLASLMLNTSTAIDINQLNQDISQPFAIDLKELHTATLKNLSLDEENVNSVETDLSIVNKQQWHIDAFALLDDDSTIDLSLND